MKNQNNIPSFFSKKFENEVMNWYKELPIHKKLDLKSTYFKAICGSEWSDFSFMICIKTRLCIFYYKLQNNN